MGLLALRPGDSLTILLDGFVNRLQDSQFPSFLLFKLRGFELLPRWDFHPLFMPAFAGRTLIITNREIRPLSGESGIDNVSAKHVVRHIRDASVHFG